MNRSNDGASSVVERAPLVRWRTVEGDLVVYNPTTDEVVHLGPIGRAIWEQVGNGATPESITAWCHEHFLGDLDQIRNDVDATVDQLVGRGLLRWTGVEPAAP